MKLAGLVFALSIAAGLPFSEIASAQNDGEWVLLGTKNVTDRVDHDVVAVTGTEGEFRRIKIEVARAPVNFRRVVVHFRNGGDQEVELRENVRAGRGTRAIDLRAGDRVIRSIEFWYEANTIGRRGATVRVLGMR